MAAPPKPVLKLAHGATPQEILEIILQASIYAGMPRTVRAMRTYRTFMREMGLLELSEPVFGPPATYTTWALRRDPRSAER